jgi:EAL domain-containing protein (putative c-di-GMP-specific phosphodiesterase class I)/CheY-like chemotaxis protein
LLCHRLVLPLENTTTQATVLVVDDDLDVLRMHRRSLTAAGMNVLTAETVDQALMILKNEDIEVVVSDLTMPGRGGLDLLRALRPVDPDLPVIFVTGDARLDSAMAAVELGANHYLKKPVDPRTLRECVQASARAYRAIGRHRDPSTSGVSSTLLRGQATIERAFDAALGTMQLVVQPIMGAATRRRVGWEALVRTNSTELRDPGALFSAAERLDRVIELGRQIRAQAAALAAQLPEGLLFVNLHPDEMLDDELYAADAPLAEHAFRIVFEVTERTALDHVAGLAERCERLRQLGYRIAVDDLGAGYAALAAVVQLRPHVVKLDMSLIRGIGDDRIRQGVVASVVDMCARLAVWTVAEGVETERELETLERLGCDLVQGFHLGRPASWDGQTA